MSTRTPVGIQHTLDDWMDSQPRTRGTDWSTSIDAANSLRATSDRLLALRTLVDHPAGLTDFELAAMTRKQQTSIGKRRGELTRAGLVEVALNENGKPVKRHAPSGALALVWRPTVAAIEYLNRQQVTPVTGTD